MKRLDVLMVLLALAAMAFGQDIQRLEKKAQKGNVESQVQLGNCYIQGIGVPKDTLKAIYWYERAAKQGEASSQYVLGRCYAEGLGVLQDATKAVYWYERAALQGFALAQNNLGSCYEDGQDVGKEPSGAQCYFDSKKKVKYGQCVLKCDYLGKNGISNGKGVTYIDSEEASVSLESIPAE